LDFLDLALNLIPIMKAIGTSLPDIIAFGRWAFDKVSQEGGPTSDDWKTLHAKEDEARAILRARAPV